MIGFGISVENFSISGTFFIATSFDSSTLGSQKKENSDFGFGCGDVGDVVIFIEEVISYVFSALGIQKKERSEMSFVRRGTSDEMNFVGGAIRSEMTC